MKFRRFDNSAQREIGAFAAFKVFESNTSLSSNKEKLFFFLLKRVNPELWIEIPIFDFCSNSVRERL